MSVLNDNSILFQVPQIIITSSKTMNPAASSFLSMWGALLETMKLGSSCCILLAFHFPASSVAATYVKGCSTPSFSLLRLITSQSFLFEGYPILYSIAPQLGSKSFSRTGAALPTPHSASSSLPQSYSWNI